MYKTYKSNSTKPKLLFLHGFNSRGNFVQPLLKEQLDFEVLSFDFPGSGTHSFESTTDIESFGEYTKRVLDQINEPVILVGHSLGGAIANAIAEYNLVKGIILLAPLNPFSENEKNKNLKKWLLPNNITEAKESLKYLVQNQLKTNYFNNLEGSANYFLKSLKNKREHYKTMVEQQILNPEYLKNDLLKHYKNNNKPTMIIQGDKDYFVSEKSSKETANAFNWKINIIPDTGHALIFERPTEVAKLINNFLMVV